ncbi:dienelactone hydrolase family protein [Acidisoma cellulosilytica]|uniref:Dienelactone hydrolase family protein n=1 Tax=Acidisoma cellulosilyticum TaxID=2802395 RepID=A0A964E1W3_9PROT|nr:dienelactone hydrolase family protein [Acidisoma cellulosilyticum]MCB8878776.1 dienelactone hydrolase family protein [Acidisoma cellulosilyticum]
MSIVTLTAGDGHQFSAYQAGPADATMGLVVVQEIFGVNGHMRFASDTLAKAGFAVICPALFDRAERDVELGYGAEDRDRGLALRAGITEAQVMLDIEAAAAALGLNSVGIIGYCWGGTIGWWGATRSTRFKAAVGWYGGGIAATRTAVPHCPVQLHFGAEDHGIPLTDVDAIRTSQPGVEVFVYDGAGHGFGCEERASFNETAFDLAQTRSLDFFRKHLAA